MSPPRECDREGAVLAAARSGRQDPAIEAHRRDCPSCAEVAAVATFLNGQVALSGAVPALPDPGLLWFKAQLAARREAAERATRPIAWAESAAWALVVLACAGLALWQGPAFLALVRGLGPELAAPGTAGGGGAALLTTIVLFGVLPLVVFLAVASGLGASSPRMGRFRPRR